tara:strand:+ start:292 stop:489 length:198 start_codon:yes stop_codon:yes gene_type:complete
MIKKAIDILWKQKPNDVWTDPDPDDLNIDNAYKTRWIWYHTILGIQLFVLIVVQIAVLVVLAVKL